MRKGPVRAQQQLTFGAHCETVVSDRPFTSVDVLISVHCMGLWRRVVHYKVERSGHSYEAGDI